jgi:hypothetical protein
VDIFRQRGLKILGAATIIGQDNADFAPLGAELRSIAGAKPPIRNLISVQIQNIERIKAPTASVARRS